MFITEKLLQHMISENSGDFISVRDLVGDEMLEVLSKQVEDQLPDATGFSDSILELSDRVHVKFPSVGAETEFPVRENLINLSPENFGEEIRKSWPKINRFLNYETYEKMNEEFPILVEMFEVRGIIFAFKLENKKENLEDVMEYMVQTEDYEKAADVRDELSKLGSDAVKSNQQ